jgi:RNA 2',3'-cyclic 3'-phosphodiesterase
MQRLFVAINLPDAVKNTLGALCTNVPGAKWVKHPQMHLTLRFIGDVDDQQSEAIKSGLDSLQAAPFEMRLEGVGQFPARGKPRVLWVGVKAPPVLSDLQQQVNTTLDRVSLTPEDHPFSPHITLARFKTPPPQDNMRQFFTKNADFKTEPFRVETFILFSSELRSEGAVYRKEGVYSLGKT